jgi:hypothetical protein
MDDVRIFYGHLVHFTVFCYILWTGTVRGNLVYYFPFCYFVPRNIWQPWMRSVLVCCVLGASIHFEKKNWFDFEIERFEGFQQFHIFHSWGSDCADLLCTYVRIEAMAAVGTLQSCCAHT